MTDICSGLAEKARSLVAAAMKAIKPISYFALIVVVFTFVSCATAPDTTTTTTTTTTEEARSPLNRNNANGLASYMH